MMPPLWYWRYTIRSREPLSARAASKERGGALIRDCGGGVGCIHPWPELGDAALDDQLAALAADQPTALGEQALLCAEADGLARREGRSLFDGLRIPPSHWSAGGGFSPPPDGFTSIKLKGMAHLARYRSEFPGHRIRLDFNETLTPGEFRAFWLGLDDDTRTAIEFIEDPVPWQPAAWGQIREELGAPIAADRDVMTRAAEADWLIVKPATINAIAPAELAWREGKRLAFTHYLDHPIGQLHAAWRAAECAAILAPALGDCGLISRHLFEPDPFFERLISEGNRLQNPGGTGLGCDDLLESLSWKPLA